MSEQHDQRIGQAIGLASFIWWGLTPVYFKWLSEVGPLEVVAHRVVWAVPLLLLILFFRHGRGFLRQLALTPREFGSLALTASLLACNWLLFIWAVFTDRIAETSIGYYISPLVTILLGYLFLHEGMSRTQAVAVAIAAAGTAYMGWYLGATPWIPLILAVSWGFYALIRKRLDVGPMVGLLWETIIALPIAVGYLIWLQVDGRLDFISVPTTTSLLLVGSGLVTITPILWFNMAAKKLTFRQMGFFQYISPTMSFVIAVYYYGEPFTQGHAVAMICILLAIVIASMGSAISARRARIP